MDTMTMANMGAISVPRVRGVRVWRGVFPAVCRRGELVPARRQRQLAAAVEGHVLLYIHKQEHLDEVMKLYPADHYVMIDDKPQLWLVHV